MINPLFRTIILGRRRGLPCPWSVISGMGATDLPRGPTFFGGQLCGGNSLRVDCQMGKYTALGLSDLSDGSEQAMVLVEVE